MHHHGAPVCSAVPPATCHICFNALQASGLKAAGKTAAEHCGVSSTAAECAALREQLHQTQQQLSTALGQVTDTAAEHSRLQTMLHDDLQQAQQKMQDSNQQLHVMAVERGMLQEQLENVHKELQQAEASHAQVGGLLHMERGQQQHVD